MHSPDDVLLEDLLARRLPFFSRLVQTESTRGMEEAAQMLFCDELKDLGLHTAAVMPPPEEARISRAPSIIATLKGKGQGRSLVLNAHMDTAPSGPSELWHRPPFSGHIDDDGTIHGRGAWDDKAGCLAMLLVLDYLKEREIALKGDLIIQSVVEDEYSGNGTASALDKGAGADAAIIIDGHYGPRYATGHPGHLQFRLTVYGKPAPSCRADKGISAISKAFMLMEKLHIWADGLLMTDDPGWLKTCSGTLINIGIIEGGEWVGTVPQKCAFEALVRFPAPLQISDVQASLEAFIRACAAEDEWLAACPPVLHYCDLSVNPVMIDRAHSFFAELENAITKVMHGPAEASLCPGWCDLSCFQSRSIPACLFGPGKGQGAHRPDESFETAELLSHVKVIIETIKSWCHIEEKGL